MIVPIDQLDDSSKRYEIWQGKTVREEATILSEESLIAAVDKSIDEKVVKNNILGTEENMLKRKKMLQTQAPEPADFALERAIGKNDSVYSNFVELINEAKRKVGRIVLKQGSKTNGYATGFMVSEKLMLTNWHVFKSENDVAESEVQFFYELDTRGNPGQPVSFKLNREEFFYAFKELDYCLVAVDTTDVTGTVSLSSIGYIYLDPALGKLGNEGEESLNIIHHPDGDFKQLSIRENLFTKIMPTTIWYESDTAQGSSGSPVFNDQWQVVGLHHMGVPRRNEQGDYLDKKGNIIPRDGNNIDVSRIHWIANEGIRISVILKDIFSKYPDAPVLYGLKQPPSSGIHENKSLPNKTYNQEKNTKMETNNTDHVQISFPASLVEASGNVNINISNRAGEGSTPSLRPPAKSSQDGREEFLEEAKKIEQEKNMDYSSCKGYLLKFLGVDIPMPQPIKSIKKFMAKLKGTDSNILKYHHYSVIFHSVRMMPVISAINVDGDKGKRLDKTKRGTDVWLRDNRFDYDIQLDDKYYRGSGFDRGHMSRREDANWGSTAEDARLFADLTCMYTNACPQINTLNQSKRGGLWGKLETVVLETGAIQERGKTAKVSVFNGPIFNDEKDPVFRGIQVPMEFYKIILWLTDKKELKATAFRLSQTELVDDIDFEAIDIDSNIEFKEYQCSIKSLERDTRLDFSHILKFDTYS
ncbi:MAG TPA: DNA/RNA non-specific endonuclease, partial [Chitinophagaceae bacterium]|nr:DNA/RNA non-specific endonuclease [Chitinophagaceae bacterium]